MGNRTNGTCHAGTDHAVLDIVADHVVAAEASRLEGSCQMGETVDRSEQELVLGPVGDLELELDPRSPVAGQQMVLELEVELELEPTVPLVLGGCSQMVVELELELGPVRIHAAIALRHSGARSPSCEWQDLQ